MFCVTLFALTTQPPDRGVRASLFFALCARVAHLLHVFLSNRFTARGARSCTVLPDYRGTGAIDYSSTTLPSPRYQTSPYRSLPHLHCTVVYQSTTASRYHRPRQRGLRYSRTTEPQHNSTKPTVPTSRFHDLPQHYGTATVLPHYREGTAPHGTAALPPWYRPRQSAASKVLPRHRHGTTPTAPSS